MPDTEATNEFSAQPTDVARIEAMLSGKPAVTSEKPPETHGEGNGEGLADAPHSENASEVSEENPEGDPAAEATEEVVAEGEGSQEAVEEDKPDGESGKPDSKFLAQRAELVKREAQLRRDREALKAERARLEPTVKEAELVRADAVAWRKLLHDNVLDGLRAADIDLDDLSTALIKHYNSQDKSAPVKIERDAVRAEADRLAKLERELAELRNQDEEKERGRARSTSQRIVNEQKAFLQDRIDSGADTRPELFARNDVNRVYSEVDQLFGLGLKSGLYTRDQAGLQKFIDEDLDDVLNDMEEQLAADKQARLAKRKTTVGSQKGSVPAKGNLPAQGRKPTTTLTNGKLNGPASNPKPKDLGRPMTDEERSAELLAEVRRIEAQRTRKTA